MKISSVLFLFLSPLLFFGCSIGENPDQKQFDEQHQERLDTKGEQELLNTVRSNPEEKNMKNTNEKEELSAEETVENKTPSPFPPSFQIQGENNGYQCTVTCRPTSK